MRGSDTTNGLLTVSVYWGPREEPVERCAERMKAFLDPDGIEVNAERVYERAG